jgi:hypothetical protein
MATITITYTPATTFVADGATQQIFGVWNPATTASDNEAFAGTYYQTNVWDHGDFGYATSLETFLAEQVAHPGLVAALRTAMRDYEADQKKETPTGHGTYAWAASDDDALYVKELEGALADQGFTFAVA